MLPQKQWKIESLIRLVSGVCIALMLGSLLLHLLRLAEIDLTRGPLQAVGIVLNSLFFQGAAIVFVAFFVRENATTWNEAFGLDAPRMGRALLLGAGVALIFLPAGMMLVQAITFLMERGAFAVEAQQAVQILRQPQEPPHPAVLVCHGLSVILLAPIAEELLFRGILYPVLKTLVDRRLALVAASAAFAIIHVTPVVIIPLFLFALMLNALYEHTGTLRAPILAHALFNLVNFLLAATGQNPADWLRVEDWLKHLFS